MPASTDRSMTDRDPVRAAAKTLGRVALMTLLSLWGRSAGAGPAAPPAPPASPQGAGAAAPAASVPAAWMPAAGVPSDPAVGIATRLPLAQDWPTGMSPTGFLVSEKLDGVRAYWDGRQLWTRGGRVLAAPAWFLAGLPAGVALDGELWLGRGRFEAVSALLRRREPDPAGWQALSYRVFDLPDAPGGYAQRQQALRALVEQQGFAPLVAVAQWEVADAAALQQQLEALCSQGAEGLMLQRADAPRLAGRGGPFYKLKPLRDAEAVVIGYTPGRGRHAGRIGALRVRNQEGLEFLLGTGLSDAERADPPAVGQVVTYTYRGLTRHGRPRFAAFLRLRDEP